MQFLEWASKNPDAAVGCAFGAGVLLVVIFTGLFWIIRALRGDV